MSSVAWSVRLLMTEDESRAFSIAARWPIHEALRTITIGGGVFDNQIEDTPYVTFELEVEQADAAERLALQLASAVLAEAGIERRSFPVVWWPRSTARLWAVTASSRKRRSCTTLSTMTSRSSLRRSFRTTTAATHANTSRRLVHYAIDVVQFPPWRR